MTHAHKLAEYLQRYNAHRIIAVTSICVEHGRYRGKINLGHDAFGFRACRNQWLAGYVERARNLGLLAEQRVGAAYEYEATDLGRAVIAEIRGE